MSVFAPHLGVGAPGAYDFFGGGVGYGQALRRTIQLGGFEYTIDTTKTTIQSRETLRDGVVVNAQVDDRLFDVQGAWARYRSSWHHGAGQQLADLREDADAFRFWQSANVDPWTEGQVVLHHATDLTVGFPPSDAPCTVVATDVFVFVADGTTLRRSATGLAGSWTTLTHGVGTINDLATDGYNVYVAGTGGVVYFAGTSTTAAQFPTPVTSAFQTIGFAANHLLGGQGNRLVEIAGSGTITAFYTHFQAAWRWTSIFAVGSRIYVAGHVGLTGAIHSLEVTSGGALAVSQESAQLAPNEVVHDGLGYGGVVVLATNVGMRLAQLGADGTLTYGPAIDEFGPIFCLGGEGRFVYGGTAAGTVIQVALDEFVGPLQPAYAASYDAGVFETVRGVARFQGRTILAVESSGAYIEGDTYERSGLVDAGELYFGTIERKGLSSIEAIFDPLEPGESITLAMADEFGRLLSVRSATLPGQTSLVLDGGGTLTSWVRVTVTLAGPGTSTPTLRRWRMRAYPVTPLVQQWVLGLLMSSRILVGSGGGQEVSLDVRAELDRIRARTETKEALVLRIGPRGWRVRVDAFQFDETAWSDSGEFFDGTLTVRLVEV